MNSRKIRLLITVALAACTFALGCDPKLTGTEGDTGTSGDAVVSAAVTAEALAVGNIVAFHSDLFTAALSVSAAFDSSSALRSFGTECVSLDAVATRASSARYELLFNGCVDGHGTAYTGGGTLMVVNDQDGYSFLPDLEVNLIRAVNESNTDYNHDLSINPQPGTIEFAFVRDLEDNITQIRVDKLLRHGVRGGLITVNYGSVYYSGAIGAHPQFPDDGSVARIVWDSVGIFDVNYSGGATALYTIAGVPYSVNLTTGDVAVVQQ